MPDWFVIAVLVLLYVVFLIGMVIAVWTIMNWAADLAWNRLRKLVPGLPVDREEYYDRTIKELEDAAAKLERLPDKDKH